MTILYVFMIRLLHKSTNQPATPAFSSPNYAPNDPRPAANPGTLSARTLSVFAMQDPDPFSSLALAPPPAPSPPPLREDMIQQAQTFLSDPRVASAPPHRAVDFLLSKDVTLAEVRTAFQRAGLAFPPPEHGHGHLAPVQRSTWGGWLWSLFAAAGVIGAVREILRRWVVPLYFPGRIFVAGGGDELRGLRESVSRIEGQARIIGDRVERLSVTMSSSDGGVLLEGGGKVGSGRWSFGSRGVLERLDELREEVESLKAISEGKIRSEGSVGGVGGEGVREFYTPRLERGIGGRASLLGSAGSGNESMAGKSTGSGNVTMAGKSAGTETESMAGRAAAKRSVSFGGDDSGDEFMKVEPAKVEKSWSSAVEGTVAAGEFVKENEEVRKDMGKEVSKEAGVADTGPVKAVDDDGAAEREAALFRFRESMAEEEDELSSPSETTPLVAFGSGIHRLSTASAPAIETALSDVDE